VVDGVVEDIVDGVVVLLLGLDHPGPEPLAEDMVLSAVPFVEGAGELAVEISHPVGEVGQRRLDDQVIVIAEQAAGVKAPAVAPADTLQDLQEDGAIPVVQEDRRVVVSLRADVVVGAVCEITVRTSHPSTVTAARGIDCRVQCLGAEPQRTRHVPGT
jgi:hypothetical protein